MRTRRPGSTGRPWSASLEVVEEVARSYARMQVEATSDLPAWAAFEPPERLDRAYRLAGLTAS